MRAIGMFGSSAFVALCSLGIVACGGSTSTPSSSTSIAQSSLARDMAPSVAPADAAALSTSNTKFAADLYKVAGQEHPSDNFFFSPYSVSIALSMAYAGAKNTTATQMASAAHFDLAAATLFPAFDALDLALASRSKPASDGTPGLELHVVNANWGEQTLAFEKPYLDTLAVSYGAGVRLTDFIHASEAARVNINSWVSDQTNAKIVDLLSPGSLTSDTRFVLVNAVYFKAGWASPFQAESTSPGAFHKLDGSTATVDQMSQTEELSYGATETYETVELPYGGGQTSMVVVVPRDGQFKTVESAMTGDMLQSTFASLQTSSKNVHLSLPKFTIKGGTISIRKSLEALGMKDAFDPSKADFSGIGNDNLSISDVLHQAFISVDEKGTEAAAATAVIGVGTSAATETTELNVNRPFFVFIRDIPTNSVLFAGRVTSPN